MNPATSPEWRRAAMAHPGASPAARDEQAPLEHRLGQFLDKERHPIGAVDDLAGKLLGEGLAAGDTRDHLRPMPRRQPVEDKRGDVPPAGPGRGELRPERDNQQNRQSRHPVDDQIQKLQRSRIAPLRILEQPQHRLARSQPLHLGDEGP